MQELQVVKNKYSHSRPKRRMATKVFGEREVDASLQSFPPKYNTAP